MQTPRLIKCKFGVNKGCSKNQSVYTSSPLQRAFKTFIQPAKPEGDSLVATGNTYLGTSRGKGPLRS